MDILSTRSVAEMLGVSEATVKRWADAETLKCFRTPGGHRKFRLRDVKAFLADQRDEVDDGVPGGAAPSSVSSPSSGALRNGPGAPSGPLTPEQEEARALALAADVDGLVSLVANQRLRGRSLAHTLDNVVSPAINDIGEGWARGALSPAQEHIAANAVKDALARVGPLVERTPRGARGRALCACIGDEHHDLAVRMVGLILTSEGYRTAMVGANIGAGDLALMIAGDPPALVALSASSYANAENLRGDLAVIASAASAVRTRIILGGRGFEKLPSVPGSVRRFSKLEDLLGAVAVA